MNTTPKRFTAHEEIDFIFQELLPGRGLAVREAQSELCHKMLSAMQGGKIALCDAGTGIGKTYSYLVAGLLQSKHSLSDAPVLISTSSIALQKAIIEEYIPFLSDALLSANIIEQPITAVIRKGKSHYVCDKRLVQRIHRANLQKKNNTQRLALLSLRKQLDLDSVQGISDFDRRQVQVDSCRGCDNVCRYRRFVKESKSPEYVIQICNHNFLLADAIHRSDGITPLLPDCTAIIIDEAHKLPEAARQLFSMSLSQKQIAETAKCLHEEGFLLAYDKLGQAIKPIVEDLNTLEAPEETANAVYPIKGERRRLFAKAEKALQSICKTLEREVSDTLLWKLQSMLKVISLFKANAQTHILYASILEDEKMGLCATISNLEYQLQRVLWDTGVPMVLTSGTLAVGDDFARFKDEVGLKRSRRSITESVSRSPFDYDQHCLLYIPKDAIAPTEDNASEYFDDITGRIEALLRLSGGRTLVLFTSYSAMSEVTARLEAKNLPYPLFPVRRNAVRTVEQFKQSGNGVLLGTGALWEGMDFPGEIVSSLIIPRLPFAVSDPLSEAKLNKYITLRDYIKAVVLPNMQIKLRQGFGRAIRTESDTCVVSILDERAMHGYRYHGAVRAALPEMPVTFSLNVVSRFFQEVRHD